jgi:hypothetical protein
MSAAVSTTNALLVGELMGQLSKFSPEEILHAVELLRRQCQLPVETRAVSLKNPDNCGTLKRYNSGNAHRKAFGRYFKAICRRKTPELMIYNKHATQSFDFTVEIAPGISLAMRLPPTSEVAPPEGPNGIDFQRAVYHLWMQEQDASFHDFLEICYATGKCGAADVKYLCLPGFHFEYANNKLMVVRGMYSNYYRFICHTS